MGGVSSLPSSYIPTRPAYVCSARIYNAFAVAGVLVVCDGCRAEPSGIWQSKVFNDLSLQKHLKGA